MLGPGASALLSREGFPVWGQTLPPVGRTGTGASPNRGALIPLPLWLSVSGCRWVTPALLPGSELLKSSKLLDIISVFVQFAPLLSPAETFPVAPHLLPRKGFRDLGLVLQVVRHKLLLRVLLSGSWAQSGCWQHWEDAASIPGFTAALLPKLQPPSSAPSQCPASTYVLGRARAARAGWLAAVAMGVERW